MSRTLIEKNLIESGLKAKPLSRGFSVIEAVITMAILFIGILAAMQMGHGFAADPARRPSMKIGESGQTLVELVVTLTIVSIVDASLVRIRYTPGGMIIAFVTVRHGQQGSFYYR